MFSIFKGVNEIERILSKMNAFSSFFYALYKCCNRRYLQNYGTIFVLIKT